MNSYRIGFVMEQTLGHVTFTANLRAAVSDDAEIVPEWALIHFDQYDRLDRLPLMRNWTIRAGRQARRQIAAMQHEAPVDALLFHTQVTSVLSVDLMRRVPSIVSLDATPVQYDQMGDAYQHQAGNRAVEAVKAVIQRLSFGAARKLMAWSRWAAQSLIHDYGVPAEKVMVVTPGIDVGAWAFDTERRPHNGPLRVLFVGKDFQRKGGPELLEAAAALPAGALELHLVTGDPIPPRPGVLVHQGLRPNSPELRELYQTADLFCLPTKGDCMPNVLFEAAAAGLPALATNMGAICEQVRHGETGLLVERGDTQGLVQALRTFVERPDLRLEMGERAHSLATTQFDVRRNMRHVLEMLKREALLDRRAVATGAARASR